LWSGRNPLQNDDNIPDFGALHALETENTLLLEALPGSRDEHPFRDPIAL